MFESQYKETYELLSFLLSVEAAFESAKADDGKITVKDAPLLLGPGMKMIPALDGVSKALPEVKSMTDEARAELLQKLKAEYDIADDKLEMKVEAGIDWILATAKFLGVVTAKAV